jgi:hypothetical protein
MLIGPHGLPPTYVPFNEIEGGEMEGGVFSKPQMKKDVAKWKKYRKLHPKSKMTLARFLKGHGCSSVMSKQLDIKTSVKKTKKGGMPVAGELEDNDEELYFDDEGGIIVGGKYRTKLANTLPKARKAFIKSLMDKDYTERGAKMLFAKEEKNPKLIKTTRKYNHIGRGIVVGGKYHRKGFSTQKSKASFLSGLGRLGYARKEAEKMWDAEEKNERSIGVVKGKFPVVTQKKKRAPSERNKIIGQYMKKYKVTLAEANAAYKRHSKGFPLPISEEQSMDPSYVPSNVIPSVPLPTQQPEEQEPSQETVRALYLLFIKELKKEGLSREQAEVLWKKFKKSQML